MLLLFLERAGAGWATLTLWLRLANESVLLLENGLCPAKGLGSCFGDGLLLLPATSMRD